MRSLFLASLALQLHTTLWAFPVEAPSHPLSPSQSVARPSREERTLRDDLLLRPTRTSGHVEATLLRPGPSKEPVEQLNKRGGTDWVTETIYVTLEPGATTETAIVTQTPDGPSGTCTVDVYVTPTETNTVYTTKDCDACEELTSTVTATTVITPQPVTKTCDTCDEDGGGANTGVTYTTISANSNDGDDDDDDDDDNNDGAGAAQADQTGEPNRTCAPGDEHETVDYGPLGPTPTDVGTLAAIPVMFLCILIGWNLIFIRSILYPVKLLVVAWHEIGHVIAVVLSGGSLESVRIDPNSGGLVTVEGGEYPIAALPAGYAFNLVIGGLLIFAGFNTLASKIASFFIGLSIIAVSAWSSTFLVIILNLVFLGVLIAFWFIDHAGVLRYLILFIGVMCLFYVVWDFFDDALFRKAHPSCCRLWEMALPNLQRHIWCLIWLGAALLFLGLFIIAGLAAFRQTSHGMFCQSQTFLPT